MSYGALMQMAIVALSKKAAALPHGLPSTVIRS
ncbi:hypothetical protein APH_1141 [Anaplasma phagocytophilum str. HZ]|uniref:Uncharacterized protein n=1 Tax=Anaplasma phagocytophilum (strain HZ) TaxID=212042 RepID=Q2GIW8_ANAPZ|nr:hypothetical protein APH_1141 [Anaplasma phagocytophilum str. HZ]